MARLKKRGDIWHARVRWIKHGKEKEKQINLVTHNKSEAYERLNLVNNYELDIKEGLTFEFPWSSQVGKTSVKRFSIQDASDQWMLNRKGKMAKKTIELNQDGLKYFLKFIGNSHPIKSISTSQIEQFTDWLDGRGLSRTSINIHLRTIKAMFNYFLKVEKLKKIPHIEQLKIPKTEPIYITDNEFKSIMELNWLGDFYKRVFLMYRETGMRLNEPMISVCDGDWIDIPNTSKGKVGRNIQVDALLQSIFFELKEWIGKGYGSQLKTPDDHLSKMFKKALRSIGADEKKHFHSLRHTFAVRRLIQGESIFQLRLMMGHSSVTTTEGYANMNMKRVQQDFPTLVLPTNTIKRDKEIRDMIGLPTKYIS